jgi:uncharacterized membrane protein YcaP (DUF421 family)
VLNWLGYQFKVFEHLVLPPPLELVRNGKMNRRNMRRELITEEELGSQLRQQGVSGLEEVKSAFLEANGEIIVVKQDEEDAPGKRKKKPIG